MNEEENKKRRAGLLPNLVAGLVVVAGIYVLLKTTQHLMAIEKKYS